MSDSDTVAGVLYDLPDGGDTVALLNYLEGDWDANQLNPGDWIRPLQLTDGRVCIEIEASDGSCWWYDWDGGLRLLFDSEGNEWPKEVSAHELGLDLAHDRFTARPLLRENTPFVEVADAE